jgi:hypothetical protein
MNETPQFDAKAQRGAIFLAITLLIGVVIGHLFS